MTREFMVRLGVFAAVVIAVIGFALWTERNGPAIGRLRDLLERGRQGASSTTDALRGLEITPPALDARATQQQKHPLPIRGKMVVMDRLPARAAPSGNQSAYVIGSAVPVSSFHAYLAEPWRARKREEVSTVMWLGFPGGGGSFTMWYNKKGVVAVDDGWTEDSCLRCQAMVTTLDGQILRDFQVEAKALNGAYVDLRSYEHSLMTEIAARLGFDPWDPEVLAQFGSPSYSKR